MSVSATGTGADVLIGDAPGTPATGFITGATSLTATADADVTVNVTQPIELNTVSAGRNANLTAPSLTLDSLQGALAGDIDIDVTQAGFTSTFDLTAGGKRERRGRGPSRTGQCDRPDRSGGAGRKLGERRNPRVRRLSRRDGERRRPDALFR